MVLHSKSPLIPTFRSDVRIFSVKDRAWLGGGADLTPYYLQEEDVRGFHEAYKELCEAFRFDYEEMKKSCDDYFFLPARQEHRGTGGIFFDDLEVNEELEIDL